MASYKFYEDHGNNKVICVSSFAGRKVRASASCAPGDDYSFEKGADLASARVDVKVADKRVKRAKKKLADVRKEYNEILDKLARMEEYVKDSLKIQENAYAELDRIEREFF